jgi:hypothetical protein
LSTIFCCATAAPVENAAAIRPAAANANILFMLLLPICFSRIAKSDPNCLHPPYLLVVMSYDDWPNGAVKWMKE